MSLDTLMDALKGDEGFREVVYDDATGQALVKGDTLIGYPTIGYGRNLQGCGVTRGEAYDLLKGDAITALRIAAELVPNWFQLDEVRRDVLGNMAFNMGKATLSKFVRFLAAVNSGDFITASNEMKSSVWYGQVGKRAVRLAEEMRTGMVS